MERFSLTHEGNKWHIDGFPDAVKVIRISGERGQQLSDLLLHQADLRHALGCLDSISNLSVESDVIREALWRSAVTHFIKCFQRSRSRKKKLEAEVIYHGLPDAMVAYKYFAALRDKHFVHDENAYGKCMTGAVLNAKSADFKIAKVVGLVIIAKTLEQSNHSNLYSSVRHALKWINAEFDKLCDIITRELEAVPYDELLSREPMTYMAPSLEEISKARPAP